MAKKEGPHLFEVLGKPGALKQPPSKEPLSVPWPSSRESQGGQSDAASAEREKPPLLQGEVNWDDQSITFSYAHLVFYLILIAVAFLAAYILGHEAGKRQVERNDQGTYQRAPSTESTGN